MLSWLQRSPGPESNINELLDRALEQLDPCHLTLPGMVRSPVDQSSKLLINSQNQPDRFAPVDLQALVAQIPEKSGRENP
jgi:hypothetical protein